MWILINGAFGNEEWWRIRTPFIDTELAKREFRRGRIPILAIARLKSDCTEIRALTPP